MTESEIRDEIRYLDELLRDRTITMAEVSAPCLRFLLGCERMQRVLDKTAELGTESPLSTATEFFDAERMKD